MTVLEKQISAFAALGTYITQGSDGLAEAVQAASLHNKWFTTDNIHYALKAIAENYLDESLLKKWVSEYPQLTTNHEQQTTNSEPRTAKRIAIVMAGNIPLAGFHDLLCVLITGNIALIKQSSKDKHLLPHLLEKLCESEPEMRGSFEFVEQLKNFDAVIATGSDNSSRYFEYYFGKYPHIIRKNRNSAAVLVGNETQDELHQLGDDIFLYFGLGCRSVSKLYVPRGYDFTRLFEALQPFHSLLMHSGYKNNYDYNLTLHLMNKTPHLASGFLILQESTSLPSPIATLNFEYYDNTNELHAALESRKDEIQCIMGKDIPHSLPFGQSQRPELWNYADGIDIVKFLIRL